MRAAKWLSIVTFGFCFISLICIVVFYNCTNAKLVYDIFLAVFGSAMLGFVMSLTQYFGAKLKAMERFYQEALKAVSAIHDAKHFMRTELKSLVVKCISEKMTNEQMLFQPLTYENRNKMFEVYRTTLPDEIINSHHLDEAFTEWYKHTMQSYRNQSEACFHSYIDISHTDLENLNNAHGNLDFFANRTIRAQALSIFFRLFKILSTQPKPTLTILAVIFPAMEASLHVQKC